jgi:uncharacterized membrane protein
VIRFILNLMDMTLVLLPPAWRPEHLLGIYIPGFGLVLAIVVLLATGFALTNLAGRRLVHYWEGVLARIPLVRSVYSGAKKVSETLLMPTGKSFRRVLLIEYPRKGVWCLGFQTSAELGEVQQKTGKHVIGVFVPTTPNPTSGFIIMVPSEEAIELEMTVDEAIRMIISLGVVVPEWPRPPGEPPPESLAPPGGRS